MKYRFKLLDPENPADLEEFERIMTRSTNGDGVTVSRLETTFTKSDRYLIAIHYLEEGVSTEDKEHMDKLLREDAI